MIRINNLRVLFVQVVIAILSVIVSSCGKDPDDNATIIIQNLMNHKWTGSRTDLEIYSYGAARYSQVWTVYFTSDHEGVMHINIVDDDTELGKSKSEEHIDFLYSVDGNKVRLSGGSNFVFDYYGDYMIQGDDVFSACTMTSSDYSYLRDHEKGYHGSDGEIDTEVYIIGDNEILVGVNDAENGWYSYVLQFGFGAKSDDAYRKGITQMKLTVWSDNGCMDIPAKTSSYGEKKTYTLNLSPTNRDWFDFIYILSKDTKIAFNYELEYYNSKNGEWYDIQSRKLTFNK